jgi:hypothetical protein
MITMSSGETGMQCPWGAAGMRGWEVGRLLEPGKRKVLIHLLQHHPRERLETRTANEYGPRTHDSRQTQNKGLPAGAIIDPALLSRTESAKSGRAVGAQCRLTKLHIHRWPADGRISGRDQPMGQRAAWQENLSGLWLSEPVFPVQMFHSIVEIA